MDYTKMTNEALLDKSHELNEKRMAIKGEMKEIAIELDRRAVEKKLDGMSESEKDDMRQLLGPSGIESGEAVGEPGNQEEE